MIKQIGLTGGIGSGKSTVARAFLALGYQVYFADDRAKALYDEDSVLKANVKALVGPEIYDANDKLIRPMLASRIFADKTLLAAINGLVHPAVAKDYAAWLASIPVTYDKKFVLKEAAILYEAGSYQSCVGVLIVYAPVKLRLQRVMNRDAANEGQIRARMAQQWPDARKLLRSDFVIYNDGIHPLTPQIARAIQYFDLL
jgi:dephospho-CoA kinase